MTSNSATDPAEAIAAALARLRGRRMPRPPWDSAHHPGPDGPWGGHHGGPRFGHAGPGGMHGGPPWMAGPRFGGPARLRLLEALAAASTPLSVSEVGEAIGVDQPRASRLVQQAAELGLVRREADPDDARRTRIALTDEGRSLVRGFRGERREAIDAALAAFTDAERAELARLLTKLADAWPR
ncbi:MarR family winged helix-turn-helix transcriptional regulator [Microbacterium sp. BK668]|uniref:MarR family winged helix-turn-helix transcriptional regulator n=1 Tax=Microbacterium sp. BK668 TaxID=2512118 RepID=UPI001FB6D7CE|nr:MarR family winged helix-turn-helix transcriptional regulator [Microbacterium sp. BK668]